ncbi:ribonuclease HII [Companilactobacillus pabuli]|jgi:ribonuclease HII|uniref:Ribonuclease HII n=1 Tax=Companilactobacillus pabuli TaxID=2714036 RepID=A0A7L7KYB4_9LACO|nr:ribonuclease HII [Companilactobacillus pabuli]AKP03962.1 ribonuclease HII [Companilactobacillus farciminis]AKS52267.1 ribonuclease HII [Companilactobacillus farciminis]MDG5113213.1 ribonuclease HII [Companilactobacillus pabuli]QMT83974.1 ribonuclease HII [Companilactobacillus pabuli]GAQ00307.1 ribonuclease HII [Companilactobacillus farciminis]
MKNKYTVKAVKELLSQGDVSNELLEELQLDSRAGVKKLLEQYYKKIEQKKALIEKFHSKEFLEKPYWDHDLLVAGVDEVGRGPLAGPVVTAAVILPPDNTLYEVDDSKKLSISKRAELYKQICDQAIDISVAVGSPQLIDQENIYHATELTMAQSIKRLYAKPNHILVDAMTIPVDIPQTKLIKGDAKSLSIGAASIIAKVSRDRLMTMYSHLYPEFGFGNNDGYGTKQHLQALDKFGRTKIHRLSFSPVKKVNKLY